jgi:hypothetical protein
MKAMLANTAGFTETVRIEDSSAMLDPAFFPNAADAQE